MKAVQYGIALGVIIMTQIFAPEIRGSIVSAPPESKLAARYESNLDDRLRTLESDAVANKFVKEMTFKHSELISQGQMNQQKITTQLKALGQLVEKMQDREYERLSKGQ